MTLRLACQNFLPTILAALAVALAACDRKAPRAENFASPPRAEISVAPSGSPAEKRASSTRVRGDVAKTPSELAQRLHAETDVEERSKIVGDLLELGTPEAV